ncbi:MAG: NifU family protein [Ignavibacteriae bacterium]|nr:NifU family protein [Ignavibacteriota bacterium]
METRIEEVIDREIRPYIEMDGGKIRFVEMKNNVVFVELAGACGSCPSSTLTLKGGVERILKRRFPEVESVELAGLGAMFSR